MADLEEQKSRLEMLEKGLYTRDAKTRVPRRRELPHENYEVKPEWDDKIEDAPRELLITPDVHHTSLFKKIFIGSVIFFIGALAFGVYSIFHGRNTISSESISISVLGPVSVGAGEVLSLDISVENRNNAPLELATLIIEYPDGTKSPLNISVDQDREREEIGVLESGGIAHLESKSVLFGEEGSTKEIKFIVEYRVRGSNGTFSKSGSYQVALSSSPVSITVSSLKEINSGQTIELTVDIVSNSNAVIKNVLLDADYPFGFSFQSATPKTIAHNQVWALGDINAHGKRTIKIKGKLEGQDGEDRVFKFNVGLGKDKESALISTAFLATSQKIAISKPFIDLALSLDGDNSANYIGKAGEKIRGEVAWANNLTDQISDAAIVVKLSGDLIDKSSVEAEEGFYRSSDNTITWEKSTTKELRMIESGGSGNLKFEFTLLPLVRNNTLTINPQIHLDVSARGTRLSETDVPEQINALVARDVKISTDLNLTARAFYSIGAFKNTGPIPPKAEQETTYTIVWSVTNSSNPVSLAQVKAVLPSYVKWKSVKNPIEENITWNPVTGEVVWDLGAVKNNVGINGSPREISFQVALSPSLSQVGKVPELIGESTLTATDTFSGGDVGATQPSLTTELLNDPNFVRDQDAVTN